MSSLTNILYFGVEGKFWKSLKENLKLAKKNINLKYEQICIELKIIFKKYNWLIKEAVKVAP